MRGASSIEVRTLEQGFVPTLVSGSAVYKAQEAPPPAAP